MKWIFAIFVLGAYGCQSTTAQKQDESLKKDADFESLMKQVKATDELTFKISAEATKEQKKIVEETVNKIVTLKEENKDLKKELDEAKAKLDSVSVDTLIPFHIRPISSKKDF